MYLVLHDPVKNENHIINMDNVIEFWNENFPIGFPLKEDETRVYIVTNYYNRKKYKSNKNLIYGPQIWFGMKRKDWGKLLKVISDDIRKYMITVIPHSIGGEGGNY